jgi:uncharacterized membrane protein
MLKTGLWLEASAATGFMAFVAYRLARPIRGVGIALPALIPPILAAPVSGLISSQAYAPVTA